MDGSRFDLLTRRLTADLSRRRGLGLLAAIGLASVVSPPQTGAKKKKKKKPCPPCKGRKKSKCKKTLPDGTACDGGSCQAGSCVVASSPPPPPPPECSGNGDCDAAETCQAGACVPRCPEASAPNYCGITDSCASPCTGGKVFAPNTCTCHCVETTCCACQGGSNPFCRAGVGDSLACFNLCNTLNPGSSSASGALPGESWVCGATVAEGCKQTCVP